MMHKTARKATPAEEYVMKGKVWILAIAMLVVLPIGCGEKKTDKEKNADDKGAIDTTVDYMTGRTAIDAKSRAYRTALQAAMRSGLSAFEAENGRPSRSLQELVDAQCLDKQFLKDEFGRPVESALEGDTLVVRSVRVDKETGKRTVNWELRF